MEPDDQLCYCFHVTRRKVINFIRVTKPQVASQLSECGGAGTGCGWCVPFLKKCFESGVSAADSPVQMSAEEYAAKRAAYIAAGRVRSDEDLP